MFTPDWQEFDPESAPRVVAEINKTMPEDKKFDENYTIVQFVDLPFYAEYQLIELSDNSGDTPLIRRALYKAGDAQILNWTNGPIYSTNEKAPLVLNNETAADYVRFFFNYVKGRHGRFIIVETPEEIIWQAAPPEKAKEALAKMIVGLDVNDVADNGTMTMLSFMVFKDSLFKANVQIQRDGIISLTDEALVVEGMPIVEDEVNEEA